MRGVCVVGGSKTGTTGLYAAVLEGVRRQEPRSYGLLEKYDPDLFRSLRRLAPSVPVVAKVLLTNGKFDPQTIAPFERQLLIVRDPRDTLLSAAMYYPVRAVNSGASDEAVAEYVELVREKERDPSSHSFLDLLVRVYRLMGNQVTADSDFSRRYRLTTEYAPTTDAHVVRYEDFIRDQLDDVSEYLGYEVRNARPTDYAGLVVRSAGAGEWRDWFTPSDVEYFRPVMAEYMEMFGYADDWELPAEPRIDPESGSGYIERSVKKRRHQLELNQRGEATVERLEQLRQRADDGAANAAFQVAMELEELDTRAHGQEIVERLRFAACCGHVRAMRRLSHALSEGWDGTPDPVEAERWRGEAEAEHERQQLRAAGGQPAPSEGERRYAEQLATELEETKRALARIRGSKRYRVASAIAEGVRGGTTDKLRTPRTVWRVLRS